MTGLLKFFRPGSGDASYSAAQARRGLAAMFVLATIVVTGFGAAQWPKAQQRSVIAPFLYAWSHDPDDPSRDETRLALALGVSLASLVAGLLLLHGVARSHARAKENEARIRDFAEVAADWFCELDADLRITYMSNRFFDVDRSAMATLKGARWIGLGKRPGLAILTSGHARRLHAREAFRDHRFRLAGVNGRPFFWSVSGKPLFDARGAFAGYRIAAADITSLLRAQEELGAARDEAQRANKAKSRFLANMGHELRTPLNAVLGFSEIIAQEMAGPVGNPKYAEYARDIHESGAHLLSIINDILELAHLDSGHFDLREQEFAIWDVIEGVLRRCRGPAGRRGIAVQADVPETLPCVRGDASRVKKILINVVANAVKFTPKGGRVWIGCRLEKDGAFSITVRDNGIGMTAQDIDKALHPFEQVDDGPDRKFEGVGLGLPLAKIMAERHGGTLRISSVPNKGTVVRFTLPAWRIAAMPSTRERTRV